MTRSWILAVLGLFLLTPARASAQSTSAPPPDPVSGGLFTVRVAWDPDDVGQTTDLEALVGVLGEVGLPVWPVEPASHPAEGSGDGRPPSGEARAHRRVGAFQDIDHARILGRHIEADYQLEWEPVRLEPEVAVTPDQLKASQAYVASLEEQAESGGRGGGRR